MGPVLTLLKSMDFSIDKSTLEVVVGKFGSGSGKKKQLNYEQFRKMLLYLLELKNSAPPGTTITVKGVVNKPEPTPQLSKSNSAHKIAPPIHTLKPSPSKSSAPPLKAAPLAKAPPAKAAPLVTSPKSSAPTPSSKSSPNRLKAPLRQIKKTFFSYHKQINQLLSKESQPSPTVTVAVGSGDKGPHSSQASSSSSKGASPAASSSSSKGLSPSYVDGTFPANTSVIPPHTTGGIVAWKRPHEMCEKPSLFVDGSEEGDVVQGALGDCWFVGAIAVLASSGNAFIEHAFTKADMKRGEYQCKFYKDGKWVLVTVDDLLPCGSNGRPYFASCLDPNEWWVPIIEKAYAKLHGGYGSIESGTITDALKDMTGEAVEILRVDEDPEFKDKSNLWKKLIHYTKESFLMGCAIEDSSSRSEQENGYGLLANHAYSIIDCQEVQGHKLMRIRNPWGKGEWKGAWSDGSKEWTPALKKHFQFEFGNDGTFFMRFEDFIKFYNRVHVLCLLTDDQGEIWHKQVLKGQWKGETAAGCTNNPSWPNNPQYLLSSPSPNNKILIGLSQQDLRYKHKKSPSKQGVKYEPLGIVVMKTNEKLVSKKKTCDASEREGSTVFMGQRDISCQIVTQKDKHYVILPCTFNSRVEQPFEIMIYSQHKIELRELAK